VAELSLSEFDCTVIRPETVSAVTGAGLTGLTILKLEGAESAFLDFLTTRLAVPGWGWEAGTQLEKCRLGSSYG
jgi:hypothetical protein